MIHSAGEYLLYAEQNNISATSFSFVPAKSFSPYVECVPTTLNRISLGGTEVEVNPYFKYERIFAPLIKLDENESFEGIIKFIFNFWIREVFGYERLTGMTKQSFARDEMMQELISGEFGDEWRELLKALSESERGIFADCISKLYSGGDAVILFTNAIKGFFPDSMIYVMEQSSIIIYVGQKETYQLKQKVKLLQSFYLPIESKVDVFWEGHFGVFGIDEVMLLDDVVLV